MLKNRNLLWLAAALVVLVAASAIQQVSHRRAVSRPAQTALLESGLAAADVTRIVAGHGADSTAVVLERLPDHWVVRTAFSHPASQQRVDDLLRSLTGLSGEFRSDDAGVLADYGLDDRSAVRVTVFGKEFQPGPEERGFAGGIFVADAERVTVLRELVMDGFDRQLLITTDICLKCMLHRYGGNGYDHIPRTIRPMMAAAGIPQTSIDQILIHNPANLLDM